MKNPRSEKAARLIGRRRGSALMMLIMALALLIGTYSATMVRQSNNARRIEKEQDAITSLENAIDAVRRSIQYKYNSSGCHLMNQEINGSKSTVQRGRILRRFILQSSLMMAKKLW